MAEKRRLEQEDLFCDVTRKKPKTEVDKASERLERALDQQQKVLYGRGYYALAETDTILDMEEELQAATAELEALRAHQAAADAYWQFTERFIFQGHVHLPCMRRIGHDQANVRPHTGYDERFCPGCFQTRSGFCITVKR